MSRYPRRAVSSISAVYLTIISSLSIADPYNTQVGEYDGVSLYSNGSPGYVSGKNNFSNGIITGMKWQCVEFVRRYYLEKFHINLRSLYTGDANTWYDHADEMQLERHANGSAVKPRVGDIVVSGGRPSGHVAIISSVSSDRICVVEQNFLNNSRDADGRHCMALSKSATGFIVGGFSTDYPIQGWLRPYCDWTKHKCAVNVYGTIAWYPAVSSCRQATQWFLMSDFHDEKVPIGSSNVGICDQVPNACFPLPHN